ncbi:MAG: helix-turn-helix domain-containing protein [Bacteroidota bacterium]
MTEISLIGFAQALFILSLLGIRKNKSLSDYLLLIFILLIGMKLFSLAADYKGWESLNSFTTVGDVFYWCLLGPLLFTFVSTTLRGSKRLKWTDLIHLLPLLLVFTAFSDFLFNHMGEGSLGKYLNNNPGFFTKAGYYIFIFVSPVYFVAALVLLTRHRRKISSFFSNTRKVDLGWLYYVTIGFGAYLIIGLISMMLRKFFNLTLPFSIYSYTPAILVAYLFGLGYIGILRLPQFGDYHNFIKDSESGKGGSEPLPATDRYRKSGLTEQEADELIRQLNEYMVENKPYLDENLNLKSLAEAIGTSTHKLSQVLNDQMGLTFFEFINKFRIEEVKKRLSDSTNQQYTLQAIAFDSGFCSKSTFYTTFRKNTGMTPGDYLKQKELSN